MELNFQVGKFYVDGHGNKWECLKTDLKNGYSIVMADEYRVEIFTKEGFYYYDKDSPNNIIGEWTEKPVVDWSSMPAWANWVAMEENGKWFWYSEKPIAIESKGFWHSEHGTSGFIPSKYAPKFDGNWKESLTERPKA